jgi:polysaccharide export outer membrane protein
MKKLRLQKIVLYSKSCLAFFTAFVLFLSSCVSPEKLRKEAIYFNEGLDTVKFNQYQLVEPVIQKGDVLQINIVSKSSSSNQIFNQNYSTIIPEAGISSGSAPTAGSNGYMVDIVTGEIKLPLLGIIYADGMTKLELEREIIKRSAEYLKEDPIVNIRYLNFRITFHGFIRTPGIQTFSSERVTFLEALGAAGGTVQGADLKKIIVIREQNGKRSTNTVDLTNGNFFDSPYYYLKQNDIVYVPPSNRQLVVTDPSVNRTLQYVSLGFNVVNIIVLFLTFFR